VVGAGSTGRVVVVAGATVVVVSVGMVVVEVTSGGDSKLVPAPLHADNKNINTQLGAAIRAKEIDKGTHFVNRFPSDESNPKEELICVPPEELNNWCSVNDVRRDFVQKVLEDMIESDRLEASAEILVVAGGRSDRELLLALDFKNVTISNLDSIEASDHLAPYQWDHQDAQRLGYSDRSYDWVLVVDGLHHCTSPHQALTEMYRVCRKGVVAVEARDSLLMRIAVRMGLSSSYELEAVAAQGGVSGGLENGPIPNHVYRWTEREFKKTIRSCDPTGEHGFHFYHGLNLPYETAELRGWKRRKLLLKPGEVLLQVITALVPKQRNSIAMIAIRPTQHHPWLSPTPSEGP